MSNLNDSLLKKNLSICVINKKEEKDEKYDNSQKISKKLLSKNNSFGNKNLLIKNNSFDNINKNLFLSKKRIFKVIYRDIDKKINSSSKNLKEPHNKYSPDNINMSIKRHFINFIYGFINQSIKEGFNQKDYNKNNIFKRLNDKEKRKVKDEDLKKNNIKDFLFLKKENELIYKNITKKIGSLYDKLFESSIYNLYHNFYKKNIRQINLEEFGVKGIKIFNLNDDIKTINDLKEKDLYKDDGEKIKKLDNNINNKFLKLFKIKKKK